jgi:hypothetical protein
VTSSSQLGALTQGAGSGMVGEVEGIGGLREERRARCVCWISWRGVVRWWMRARSDGINGGLVGDDDARATETEEGVWDWV